MLIEWIWVYIKYKIRLQGKEGSKNRDLFLLVITNQELEGWSSVKVLWQIQVPDRISQILKYYFLYFFFFRNFQKRFVLCSLLDHLLGS